MLLVVLPAAFASGSEWLGGDADWFDQNNWDAGVPNMSSPALVNSGVARFDQPATAGSNFQGLVVGGRSSTGGVFFTEGEINGADSLTIFSKGVIGTASGTGTGTERKGVGRLILNGGDLISKSVGRFGDGGFAIAQASGTGTDTHFAAEGEVQITNGSLLSEGPVVVGHAGGTGTGGTRTSHGSLSIMGGDLRALSNVRVGSASGTGSTDGFANGVATITDGDVIVTPYSSNGDEPISLLSVGISGGTSNFDGTANGELLVERGDIEAWMVRVGFAGGIARSTSRANGRLTQRNGDLRMQEMTVGVMQDNGVEVSGVFHLADGVVYGNSFEVGLDGTVVLEIGDDGPSFAASPDPTPFGRLLVDQVALNGELEARFTDGFTPLPGDTYDLIVADSLTGNFDLLVTGLSPQAAARLKIATTPTLLQLHFIVPEPTTLLLLGLGSMLLGVRQWR